MLSIHLLSSNYSYSRYARTPFEYNRTSRKRPPLLSGKVVAYGRLSLTRVVTTGSPKLNTYKIEIVSVMQRYGVKLRVNLNGFILAYYLML